MSPRGRPRTDKGPKRKAVKIRLAPRIHAGEVTEPYKIMEAVIESDRKDLANLKIGIAWHTGWRPDADNIKTHGKCLKRSDLDRSLDGYDAMIVLSETSWLAFGESDQLRLITHELEHLQITIDKNGEPLIDDKGRQVIRMRRHDVADFASIIQKFGLPPCLTDVQIHDADRPLLQIAEEKGKSTAIDSRKGGRITKTQNGVPTATTEEIPLKFRGLRNAKAMITVTHQADGWRAGYEIKVGNLEKSMPALGMVPASSHLEALQAAKSALQMWAEEVEPSGSADTRRATTSRLASVCEQIDAQLDPMLNAAEEFAEGGPKEDDEDADEDLDI
jgi:hypothetical protein